MVPKNNQAKTHRQLFPQTIFLRRFSSDNFFLQATFLQILFFFSAGSGGATAKMQSEKFAT
jgi:hypothetical protein